MQNKLTVVKRRVWAAGLVAVLACCVSAGAAERAVLGEYFNATW